MPAVPDQNCVDHQGTLTVLSARWWWWIRIPFFLAIGWFIWRGIDGHQEEIGDALGRIGPTQVLGALGLVVLGLLTTGLLWSAVLAALGHRLPLRAAFSVFFVGQLGKYVPGSVWSFGVQAQGARRYGVPIRSTVAASLVFLGINVASSVAIGAALALTGDIRTDVPAWVQVLALVASLLALTPPALALVCRVVAGIPVRLSVRAWALWLSSMALAWVLYLAALALLLPDPGVDAWFAVSAGFLVGYATGVLVILAPAGLGARETAFVVLAEPAVGLATATAIALISRLVWTAGDVVVAAGAALASRTSTGDE